MPFFNKKEKDTTGAYLAGAGALAALPASEYLAAMAGKSAVSYSPKELALVDNLSYRNVNLLKNKILKDPELARQLPVIMTKSPSMVVDSINKGSYIPGIEKNKLLELIKQSPYGIEGAGGDYMSTSDFIKRVRNTGGYVNLNNNATLLDAAHELGHASVYSPTSSRAGNIGTHRLMQSIGRYNPAGRLLATSAATAASLMQDDPNSPLVYAPAAVLAAPQIPVLREEYIASAKGHQALKELESAGVLQKGVSELAKSKYRRALGSYGAIAAGLTAVPALAALARQRYNTEVSSSDSNTGLSIPAVLGIGAGGALASLAAYKYGPKAFHSAATSARDFLDDLISSKMAKGQNVNNAVQKLNNTPKVPNNAPSNTP